jgi:hypothetical protein
MSSDVTVQLAPGRAVVLDGLLYLPGERIELDEDTARHWQRKGWAVVPADQGSSVRGAA